MRAGIKYKAVADQTAFRCVDARSAAERPDFRCGWRQADQPGFRRAGTTNRFQAASADRCRTSTSKCGTEAARHCATADQEAVDDWSLETLAIWRLAAIDG